MSPTSLEQLVRDARRNNDYSPLVELIPYAKLLGIECLRLGDDMVFRLPANKDNIGNPTLPAIHGGVIAGFMEHAAMLHLLTFMRHSAPAEDHRFLHRLPACRALPRYLRAMPGLAPGATGGERRDQRLADHPGRAHRHCAGAFQGGRAVSRTLRKVG